MSYLRYDLAEVNGFLDVIVRTSAALTNTTALLQFMAYKLYCVVQQTRYRYSV